MFKLDSDILGLLFAIITFLLPAISALLDKKRKKRKAAVEAPEVEESADAKEEDIAFFDLKSVFEEAIQDLEKERDANESAAEAADAVDVLPEAIHVEEPVEVCAEEAEPATVCADVVPETECPEKPAGSIKERLKNNPKDMVLFAEIMNPKFKHLFLLILAVTTLSCNHRGGGEKASLTIETAVAEAKEVPYTKHFIAPVSANYSATVQPRIAGFLVASSFKNGMPVNRGDLIFTLDDAPQRANRLSAEASLSSARAKAAEAKRNYERAIPLIRINAISQTQFDQYTAENLAAIAAVKSAEQALRNAQLDESYTRIYAPIKGIISSSAATAGDYVGPGTQFSTLTTIQNIDTIGVDIAIPMGEYLATTGRKAFSYDNASLLSDIRLQVADGTLYPEEGFYQYTRQSVASEMGSIVLVVGFRNPDYALKVGQFARITASLGSARKRIVVPQSAVMQIQNISSVWVIRPDSTAEYRKVRLGETADEWWIVEEGLSAGEVVATTGLQKLHDGMKVSL